MINLVTNAVQAMPKGGKLAVKARMDADFTVLVVKDTGVGIHKDVSSKMFTPLFTTKAKGQGFGLAVVKKLTEGLNGKVSFESQVGKGTRFILQFPLEKVVAPVTHNQFKNEDGLNRP